MTTLVATPAPAAVVPAHPPWGLPPLGSPRLTLDALLAGSGLPSALDVGPSLLLVERRRAAVASTPSVIPLVPFEDVVIARREQRRRTLLIGAAAVGGATATGLAVVSALT